MSAFSNTLLLGLDDIERVLGQVARKGGDGYPPYDIERFPKSEDRDEVLRITFAVAGFRAEDLDVTAVDNQLVIRGRQVEEPARTYLHRGIAARRFQKTFVLAEGMKVLGADLRNGLLSIDIARPVGARAARTVTINGSAS
ncbi:MAG: Hsp20 family protein [Bauldia sp.]